MAYLILFVYYDQHFILFAFYRIQHDNGEKHDFRPKQKQVGFETDASNRNGTKTFIIIISNYCINTSVTRYKLLS